jgi:hypothetical protein
MLRSLYPLYTEGKACASHSRSERCKPTPVGDRILAVHPGAGYCIDHLEISVAFPRWNAVCLIIASRPHSAKANKSPVNPK